MAVPAFSAWRREIDTAVGIVRDVVSNVDRSYQDETPTVYTKSDGSPVTDADLEANRAIREALQHAFPGDGLLTEETDDGPYRLERSRCWIADPLDGTAQFVARTGEFDVMLALVVDHQVVVAVTGHPPTGTLLLAVRDEGAWRLDDHNRESPFRIAVPEDPPRLVTSEFYGADAFADAITDAAAKLDADPPEVLPVGFQPRAFLPEYRRYDAFVGFWRSGDFRMREWDLAACDLIVTEAGGRFTNLYGRSIRYNLPEQPVRIGLLVSASIELHDRLVEALAPALPPEGDHQPG